MSVNHHSDRHCQHINGSGHRCRSLVSKDHSSLCAHHLAQSKAKEVTPDPELVASDLLNSIEDFTSAESVNLFLGNLLRQAARKRIARPDAIALAYISQLLLNSLSGMIREQRHADGSDDKGFRLILDSPRPWRGEGPEPPDWRTRHESNPPDSQVL